MKKTFYLLGGVIFFLALGANSSSQEIQPEDYLVNIDPELLSPSDSCIAKAGDLNGDNKVSLVDIVFWLRCFYGPRGPFCNFQPPCRADINGDGLLWSVGDLVYLVRVIFEGGAPVKSDVCCL